MNGGRAGKSVGGARVCMCVHLARLWGRGYFLLWIEECARATHKIDRSGVHMARPLLARRNAPHAQRRPNNRSRPLALANSIQSSPLREERRRKEGVNSTKQKIALLDDVYAPAGTLGPSRRASRAAEQADPKTREAFFGCRLPAFESWEHWRGRQQGPAGRIWDVRSFGEVSEVKKQALKA